MMSDTIFSLNVLLLKKASICPGVGSPIIKLEWTKGSRVRVRVRVRVVVNKGQCSFLIRDGMTECKLVR